MRKHMKRIVDTLFTTSKIDLVESEGVKKYIISGKYTVVDRPNGNNRIYPREVMQKAIEKLRCKVADKTVRMALDHPYGEGRLADVAALLLEITDCDAEGFAYYKAQILDTTKGKDLKVIVDAGSPVGVSTRGFGDALYDQEWQGLPGKYVVIRDGFELENIDFVDTPSVSETQDDITLECKKRSESTMKTLEELRKEHPQAFVAFDKQIADEQASYKTMIDTLKAEAAAHINNITKLVDVVKTIKPELFTTIPESEVIAKSNEKIMKMQNDHNESLQKISDLKTQLETVEGEKTKIAKEKQIETLKSEDPEFFTIPSAVSKFETCVSAEEVKQVYESNKAILDDYKKTASASTSTSPKAPKTKDVKNESQSELNEAQTKHMKSINIERRACGLSAHTTESYLKEYPAK